MAIVIDELKRSTRKSIGLEITPDAKLIIRAPIHVSKREIYNAIEQKIDWISEKQQQARQRRSENPPKSCKEGEKFLLFGKTITLIFEDDSKAVEVRDEHLYVPTNLKDYAETAITEWYKSMALAVIRQRVGYYETLACVSCQSLKITGALKRWGSCSGKSRLCFTWRLALVPIDMLDYVVVHELSHIGHPDHSKAFWNRVGELMPDYQSRREWFRENSALLRPDFFEK